MTHRSIPASLLVKSAMRGRCPRCGVGALFIGYLRVVPVCAVCGLSFTNFATDDGPVSFVILPLCFLTAGGSLVLEVMMQPPMWVHVLVWPTLIALAVGFSLRPVKAAMIAIQYRNRERNEKAFEASAPIENTE